MQYCLGMCYNDLQQLKDVDEVLYNRQCGRKRGSGGGVCRRGERRGSGIGEWSRGRRKWWKEGEGEEREEKVVWVIGREEGGSGGDREKEMNEKRKWYRRIGCSGGYMLKERNEKRK